MDEENEKGYTKKVCYRGSQVPYVGIPNFKGGLIAVPVDVSLEEYERIVVGVKKGSRGRTIKMVNWRMYYPPYPPVLWLSVKTLEDVLSVNPQFDDQLVILTVGDYVHPRIYVDIVFHAERKGFLVLNTGPWTELKSKSKETLVRDDSIFGSMLDLQENRLKWLDSQIVKERALIGEFKATIDRDLLFVGSCAETCGSVWASAEEESRKDALLESKQEELSDLSTELLHLETFKEEFKSVLRAANKAQLELMEVCKKLITIEAEFEQIQNQLNAESRSCCSHSYAPFGVPILAETDEGGVSISRRKSLKNRSWSLFGICASLGLYMLFAHLAEGAKPHPNEYVD